MADEIIENFLTKLGFDIDDADLKKFEDNIKSTVKGLTALVAVSTAAAAGIFAFTKNIAASNDELGKFSQTIGIDVQTLQELGYAAELNGGSIDSMNSSLANLSRIASEASRGIGSGVEVFGMLGITVSDAKGQIKGTDVLLGEVADRLKGLNTQAERLEFANKLGINEDLLLTLQQGSKALNQQRKEAQALGFVVSKEDTQIAAEFNDNLLRVTKTVKGLASEIGTELAKEITPILKQFSEWYKINRDLIKQNIISFFKGLTQYIRTAWNIAVRFYKAIDTIVNAMGGWKNAIIAVTALIAVLNANALLLPLLVIGLGAGILLILEDIITFAKGGDSVLGDMIKKFPALKRESEDLNNVFKGIMIVIEELKKLLTNLSLSIRELIPKDFFKNIIKDLKEGIPFLNKLVDKIPSGLKEKVFGKNITSVDFIPGLNLLANIGERGSIIPKSITNQRSNTNNRSQTNNVTINIAEGTKENVQTALNNVLLKAKDNLTSKTEY